QLLAVRGEKPTRFVVALVDDREHFGVDRLRGRFAERLLAGVTARAPQVGILPRGEVNQADSLAHAPARDHAPGQGSGLLDVTLGPGRLGAVDDLLSGATSECPDDLTPKIVLWIIIAIAVGPLIGHPESLSARDDGHPVHR